MHGCGECGEGLHVGGFDLLDEGSDAGYRGGGRLLVGDGGEEAVEAVVEGGDARVGFGVGDGIRFGGGGRLFLGRLILIRGPGAHVRGEAVGE